MKIGFKPCEFLSLSSKVEVVSNAPQNLPFNEASDIRATREPYASSITSEDMPPLGVILTSVPLCKPSPVTLTSSAAQRTAESLLVSTAKAPYEQTEEGICISIPVPPAPVQRNDFNFNYEDGADSDGEVGPFYGAVQGEGRRIQVMTSNGTSKY